VNKSFIFCTGPFWIMGLVLFLAVAPGQAAPIRVTTWDLQPAITAATNGIKFQHSLLEDAAQSLKQLQPDVIMLQGVRDWENCHQLAQALQPAIYQVVVCSLFRDRNAKVLSRQVAILSKTKAYLTWSEQWQQDNEHLAAPGGFAFAAIQLGNKNVALFSADFGDDASSGTDDNRSIASQQACEESARQLVQQIASLRAWQNNRVQTFIVGGDFNTTLDDSRLAQEKTLSLLEQSGFANAFAGLPLEKRVTLRGDARQPAATLDYIFTRDAGQVGAAVVTPSALCEHAAVTCEMDSALPKAIPSVPPLAARTEPPPTNLAVNPASRSAASPAPTNATAPAVALPPPIATRIPASLASATHPAVSSQTPWWVAGFVAGCVALYVLARKLVRRSELPDQSSLIDLEARTGGSIASSTADQIVVAPPPERPPYVRIEMDGSMQTQSQTWRPHTEAGRLTPRMTNAVREGVIANLSRWLKQKALQRLISDREQLMAAQQAAGLKVLAVDQRLARIEHQIQQMNQAYEQRIDDLLQQLLAAKEENRELIRAKIALAKAEMEKARLKAGQPIREHQQF
jgi:endonuclease/exonuclease/phosphatase family metal-dependent hydrolase/uncharacterized protein YeeX (DUF496 family)